jgi:hypothetical protein
MSDVQGTGSQWEPARCDRPMEAESDRQTRVCAGF